MIAVILVIFIHARLPDKVDAEFPDNIGWYMDIIARFAVPFFFAISGYFSYLIRGDKVAKRLRHIFVLNVVGTLVFVIYFLTKDPDFVTKTFTMTNIAKWLLIHTNPTYYHLWYLTAMLFCYFALWIYVTFFNEDEEINYKPLYVIGVLLFAFQIAFGSHAQLSKWYVSYLIYRNGLFFGLPMFALGIFIREHEKRIITNFKLTTPKLIFVFLGGIILGYIQSKGVAVEEMPLGMLFSVIALLLFSVQRPTITTRPILSKFIATFGSASTFIYIMHPLFILLYRDYVRADLKNLAGSDERFYYPLLVMLVSVVSGLNYAACMQALKSLFGLAKKKIRALIKNKRNFV
jgi:peptidoglycan/LPS O-acetylase OafA/YrhL